MLRGQVIGLRARLDSDIEVFEAEMLNDWEIRIRVSEARFGSGRALPGPTDAERSEGWVGPNFSRVASRLGRARDARAGSTAPGESA